MAGRKIVSGWVFCVVAWGLTGAVSCSARTDGSSHGPIARDGGSGSVRIGAAGGSQGGIGGAHAAGAGGAAAVGGGGIISVDSDAAPVPQPFIRCEAVEAGAGTRRDAGDAASDESCAPPPSICADYHTLAYFSNGRCVSGHCQWQTDLLQCPVGCTGSGCTENITR